MKEYLIARAREASTWRGLALFVAALGVHLDPEQIEAIVSVGLAVSGVIGMIFPDKTDMQK